MSEDIFEQAARWHAMQDRDDMDWDAFTAWLEANPRHRGAFDEIALLDERIDLHRRSLLSVVAIADQQSLPDCDGSRRRRSVRWGLAAASVAGIAMGTFALRQSDPQVANSTEYRAASTMRVVDLGRGVRASLAPGSALVAGGNGTGRLTLSGRALFEVVHDPDRQVIVEAGGYRIRDVGTRFEVVTGGGMVRVAVSNGRVAVMPPSGAPEVELSAGRSLTGSADGRSTTMPTRSGDVGAWKAGPMVYDQTPLAIVVADVSRTSGRSVTVDPALASRPFSGVLAPAAGDEMVAALGSLAGLQARRDGDAIRLRDRTPR
ncbi:FecR domain-containing protein [Sphingomonas sp. A2-49]|uniref:FecR family protein n=1 Tax=Sphingomonas sp. A2-49 TaxID=1391375 RepID=UPI0021D3DB88|nr:FecR domain-containing protein [Sphingomonas sp. A2-49]MCU6453405.1 FecR domain-containing protein [Sphingomonas sp. A2-49]